MAEMLTDLVQKNQNMEMALAKVEEELKRSVETKVPEVQMVLPCAAALRHEMRRAMVPKGVVNTERRCLRLVNQSSCFNEDPTLWTTKCGWQWIRSHNAARPLFDDDNLELVEVEASQCGKCFAKTIQLQQSRCGK